MKVKGEDIEFGGLAEFSSFMAEVGPYGAIKLREPITDNNGNILIKENIQVKSGMLQKLQELDGQYQPTFVVGIDDDLIKGIRLHLASAVFERIKKHQGNLIGFLLQRSAYNPRPFIRNSILARGLLLGFYRIYREGPDFFNHSADLGLLTLGFSLHQRFRKRMMHRYAFLAGLCADIGLSDGNEWRRPAEDSADAQSRTNRSVKLLERLSLPAGLSAAIREHRQVNDVVQEEEKSSSPFDGIIEDGPDKESAAANTGEADAPDDPADQTALEDLTNETQVAVTELLRVARFVQESMIRSEEGNQARRILERLAYNCARGFYAQEVLDPILKAFREYETTVRHIMHVAAVERMCIHPPSAWAYPKPNAAQILCREHVQDCPHLVTGWDIQIVSAHEAFGWIGATLAPGNYQKCQLEQHLKERPPEGDK